MARVSILESDALHPSGADSFRDPRLPEGFYQRGWNIVNRGGVLKTRPGTEARLRLPDGKLQGFTHFTPRRGPTQLVAIVDGVIYVSEYPFRTYRALSGATMSTAARSIHFCRCEQAVRRNADDSVSLLEAPKALLMMQDGASPATSWDGFELTRHTGYDTTPQGTAMAWSGGRLWVARDAEVFASDYANPTSFVEQFYLGGTDSFLVDGRVVAMSEIEGTGNPQLLVFTETSTTTVQSNVRNRDLWLQTPNFIKTIFPSTGCVSHRSVIRQLGQIWWYSQHGLVNYDIGAAENVSSAYVTADNEMAASRAAVVPRESTVATGTFGNYLLVSVPHAGRGNRHTWVLDQSVIQTMQGQSGPAWAGVWTGFQAVEWATFVEDGTERVFAAATDGTRNQILEFREDVLQDSGQDIECAVELRVMVAGADVQREIRNAELFFSELRGTVDIRADWRGLSRGAYKECLTTRVEAGQGLFRPGATLSASSTLLFSTRGQSRRLWTREIATSSEAPLSSAGIEQPERETKDYGFNLLVSWSGRAALRGIRLGINPEIEREMGKCESPESEPAFVRFDGLAATDPSALELPLPIYSGTAAVSGTARGITEVASATCRSLLSEETALKQATQYANGKVARALLDSAPLVLSTDVP